MTLQIYNYIFSLSTIFLRIFFSSLKWRGGQWGEVSRRGCIKSI